MVIKAKDFGNGVFVQVMKGSVYLIVEFPIDKLPISKQENEKTSTSFDRALDYLMQSET